MAATERVPVLMTLAEKKKVEAKAKKAGLKTSAFMRLAADGYEPEEDRKAIETMIDQMNLATRNIGKAIDNAMAFVAKSNKRIEKMEAKANRK